MRLIDLDNLDYEDLYTRDEIYYRNTFESGVRSTLNKLAKGKEQIVHCKDCKYWGTGVPGETENIKCCEYGNYMVGANGYCVYGEKECAE